VWTPKRILLLTFGFIVFLSAYLVYAQFLGGIDGLPPLPEEFWPRLSQEQDFEPPLMRPNDTEKKLRTAFGEDERILNCPIKLEIRAKGVVMASEQFEIQDGGVKLTPFFMAIFGKEREPGKLVEINTIRSGMARLTFDKPINAITEIGNRKIVGATLDKDVLIVNNRRTPQLDDDISISTPGPLHYAEGRRLIYADPETPIRILDPSTKPNPTSITATGTNVFLTVEEEKTPPEKGNAAKRKNDTISGVDRIVLLSNVDMNLSLDGKSGFLGGNSPAPAKAEERPRPDTTPAKAAPATGPQKPPEGEKARVLIQTQGPFTYDLRTDFAVFEISKKPNPSPNNVVVKRLNEAEGKLEQLVCDYLELQFRRKNAAPNRPARDDRSVELEIDWAHATGANVTLTSDAENLNAFGNDLRYEAATRTSILKGEPEMVAAKDGNFIHARELRLQSDPSGQQQATARGPGRIEMLDRATGQRPLLALWRDELQYGKEGVYDVLCLTGGAVFEDKEHGQQLFGDRIKVWLEPKPEKPAAKADSSQPLPHHLEATGHVRALAAEMRVQDAERLVVWFRDGDPAAAAATPPGPTSAPPTAQKSDQPAQKSDSPAKPAAGVNDKQDKPKPPLELKAHTVEAHVVRVGSKNDLEKLSCEGSVHVHQEPTSPEDKGVDIRGVSLELLRQGESSDLTVRGDPAKVQFDKLTIFGPDVHVDQLRNQATVNGNGAMRMPTNSNLNGDKLAKPSEVEIFWQKSMYFDGKFAEFVGGVEAKQETSKLQCLRKMTVSLDRQVSFQEGPKGQQPRIQKVLCEVNVKVEDTVTENGKLRSYRRIECPELELDNETGRLNAAGPGVVRILQPGTTEDGTPQFERAPAAAPARPAKPAKKEDEELKLTRVTYSGRMAGDNNKRMVSFFDDVDLVHVPSEDPNLAIDLARLPAGALHIQCKRLEAFNQQGPGGKASQEMQATGKVFVEAQEQFYGRADIIKFDESQEKIIFEGTDAIPAVLYRLKGQGVPPDEIPGRKIHFWRRTNDFKVEGGRGITIGK
jgi:hypothetical protein